MPRFAIEGLVVGTVELGIIEAATAGAAEAAAWAAVNEEDLIGRLPNLQRAVVEHIMVEPARPADSEVMP